MPTVVAGVPIPPKRESRRGVIAWLCRQMSPYLLGQLLFSESDVCWIPSWAFRRAYVVDRALLFRWEEVLEVDDWSGRGLGLEDRVEFALSDGSEAVVSTARSRRLDDVYRAVGFEEHRSDAWPGRVRWARAGTVIDWNARRDTFSIPRAAPRPWV
jgi:hypothetical protein